MITGGYRGGASDRAIMKWLETYSFHFERHVALAYLPIMWVAAFTLAVGSSGELGCVFSDGCDHPWSSDKRTLFFVLLLGPPLAIWAVWGIIVWLIHVFSPSN